MWTKKELEAHKVASGLLEKIRDQAFEFIRENANRVTEWDVQQFIHKKFKENRLVTTDPQIVAFNENCGYIHYFAKKNKALKLKPNTLILMDLWARLRDGHSPYADLTWMAFHGKPSGIPKSTLKVFNTVFKARDLAISHVKNKLAKGQIPTGGEIDKIARDYIEGQGYHKKFRHSLGHGLGFASPHWRGRNLRRNNNHPLATGIGYTIEPGVYLEKKCGARSEMDFFLTKDGKFMFTCNLQKKMFFI